MWPVERVQPAPILVVQIDPTVVIQKWEEVRSAFRPM
jgi:hypothetical protein